MDYESIPFGTEEGRDGYLYRGNGQYQFEEKLLDTFLKRKPHYFGTYFNPTANRKRKITFVDSAIYRTLYFMEKAIKEFRRSDKGGNFEPDEFMPFSQSAILLEINAEPYKDKIYESNTGEGLVILGPIDLEDITAIFSTEKNETEGRVPEPMNSALTWKIGDIEEQIREHGMTPEKSLLRRYDSDPERTLRMLWGNTHLRSRTQPSVQDLKNLEGYIEMLRKFYRK